ncbi:hypothetical protein QL285_058613 [Trifolium repens]|nr:hypothetical protein QL285_058613 [Trifolium repens]
MRRLSPINRPYDGFAFCPHFPDFFLTRCFLFHFLWPWISPSLCWSRLLCVEELNDYKWRLTNDQKIFLDLALELSRRLEKDVAFIETTNAVFKCYNDLEDTLEQKISVTKDSIDLQEESLYLNLSAEEAVENRIEVLEKELRPLMKRKRNLQLDIEYDVARLTRTRSSLTRLKEKMERLQDDQDRISPYLTVAKKYKEEIEELQADVVAAAYVVA